MPWLSLLLPSKNHTLQNVLKEVKTHPSQSKIQLLQKSARFDLLECCLSQPQGTDFCSRLAFSRYGAWLCYCLFHCALLEVVHTAMANYAFCFMGFQFKAAPLGIQQEQVQIHHLFPSHTKDLGPRWDAWPPTIMTQLITVSAKHSKGKFIFCYNSGSALPSIEMLLLHRQGCWKNVTWKRLNPPDPIA